MEGHQTKICIDAHSGIVVWVQNLLTIFLVSVLLIIGYKYEIKLHLVDESHFDGVFLGHIVYF